MSLEPEDIVTGGTYTMNLPDGGTSTVRIIEADQDRDEFVAEQLDTGRQWKTCAEDLDP